MNNSGKTKIKCYYLLRSVWDGGEEHPAEQEEEGHYEQDDVAVARQDHPVHVHPPPAHRH